MNIKMILRFTIALSTLSAGLALSAEPDLQIRQWTTLNGEPATYIPTKPNVLVVLWATWCSDCRDKFRSDLPELSKRTDLEIITVNTEKDSKRVESFISREGIRFPVFLDPTKNFRKSIKAFSVPHWAIYRKDGDGTYSLVKSESAFDRHEVEGLLK